MNILIITHALNGLLMIAMPVGLAIFLTRRWKMGWGVWWIGLATFIISQVGHLPFNWAVDSLLDKSALLYWPRTSQLIFSAAFLGLSAGVFEEVSRYLVLRFWAKKARSWRSGVLFGAGHGGSEAIILGLLVLLTYVNMLVIRTMDLSTLVPPQQLELAQQQVAAYWSAPWYLTLLGALERLLTIPAHIFMAVLVMQAFTRRNLLWLFAAIFYHALLDASAVLALEYVGPYWTEALIAIFALASLVLTFALRQPEPRPDLAPAPGPAPLPPVRPPEETDENLDRTRYQ